MKTNREQLLKTLSLLRPATKVGGHLPEYAHIWFGAREAYAFGGGLGDKLGVLGARVKLDVGLKCGVPGGVLLGLLASSRLPEVSLSADEREDSVVLKLGRSVSKLGSLAPDRGVWPFPKDGEPADRLRIDDAFLAALSRVLIASPTSVGRVDHRGVVLYRDKDGTTLSATDSATIAVVKLAGKLKRSSPALMLPRTFAEQVVKTCAAGDDLLLFDDYMVAVGADVSLYVQTIDMSDAQDVRVILSETAEKHPEPVPVPAGLKIAMERAGLLAGGDDAVVEVGIVNGDLVVRGKYKYGELGERVRLKAEHPDARGQYTASLILRGLDEAKTFSLDENALLLYGGRGDVYAVASRRA